MKTRRMITMEPRASQLEMDEAMEESLKVVQRDAEYRLHFMETYYAYINYKPEPVYGSTKHYPRIVELEKGGY
jgi:hypothetical protein